MKGKYRDGAQHPYPDEVVHGEDLVSDSSYLIFFYSSIVQFNSEEESLSCLKYINIAIVSTRHGLRY